MDEQQLASARALVAGAGRVVAFTGAGVSAESGIPTFRGAGGIWETYDPAIYGNVPGLVAAFVATPQKVVGFVLEALRTFLGAEPNPAHRAIASLEQRGRRGSVITQNIDDLHEAGGSGTVIKLHGDLYGARCLDCSARRPVSRADLERIATALEASEAGRIDLVQYFRKALPGCERCGGTTRPDVVFFGEMLPSDALAQAQHEVSTCDLLLIVGTSGVVYPAAALPFEAKQRGAKIVECNGEPTPYSEIADVSLFGAAGDILPGLVGVQAAS